MKYLSILPSAATVVAAITLQLVSLQAQDGAQDNNGQRPNRRQGGGPGGGGGGPGGPGNFDPEEMRRRMMDRYREQLGVKDDDEWKLISSRIEKVSDARREIGFRGMGFGGFGGRGGGPGGGGRRGGGENAPEADSLQKAVDANASADEIKTKLAAYRTAQKEKEAKLEKAQDELRKVLSVKQEAAAVLMGLLK